MTNQLKIRAISSNETLPLRCAILRPDHPIQESIYAGDDDPSTQHWGAFVEDALIVIASLYPEPLAGSVRHQAINKNEGPDGQQAGATEHAWRLRGMAVHRAFQRKGYGRQLLHRCLESVADHGGTILWCNARSSAVGFYRGAGFETAGTEFVIPGIGPHYVMLRRMHGLRS